MDDYKVGVLLKEKEILLLHIGLLLNEMYNIKSGRRSLYPLPSPLLTIRGHPVQYWGPPHPVVFLVESNVPLLCRVTPLERWV